MCAEKTRLEFLYIYFETRAPSRTLRHAPLRVFVRVNVRAKRRVSMYGRERRVSMYGRVNVRAKKARVNVRQGLKKARASRTTRFGEAPRGLGTTFWGYMTAGGGCRLGHHFPSNLMGTSKRTRSGDSHREDDGATVELAEFVLDAIGYQLLDQETRNKLLGTFKPWILKAGLSAVLDEDGPEVVKKMNERLCGTAEKAPAAIGCNAPHKRIKPSDLVRSHKLKEGATVWVRAKSSVAVEGVLVDEPEWTKDTVFVKLNETGATVSVSANEVVQQDTSHYIPHEDMNSKLIEKMDLEFGIGMWKLWTKTSHVPGNFNEIGDITKLGDSVYVELDRRSHIMEPNDQVLSSSKDFCLMPRLGLWIVLARL